MTDKPSDSRQPIKFQPEEIDTIKNLADDLAAERGLSRVTYRDAILEAVKFYSENRQKITKEAANGE